MALFVLWGAVGCWYMVAADPPAPVPPGEPPARFPVVVTLAVEEDHWFAPVEVGAKREKGWMLVDTGADGVYLAPHLVRDPLLRVGGIPLDPLPARGMHPQRLASQSTRRRVVGILGHGFFAQYLVKLDPRALCLTVFPKHDPPRLEGVTWVSLSFFMGTPYATLKLNGRDSRCLVDLGAPDTMVQPRFAAAITLTADLVRPLVDAEYGEFNTAQGRKTQRTITHSLKLGSLVVQEPIIMIEGREVNRRESVAGFQVFQLAESWWDYAGGRLGVKPYQSGPVKASPYVYDHEPVYASMDQGKFKEALSGYRVLKAQYSRAAQPWVEEAECLGRLAEFSAAEGTLRLAAKAFPLDPDVHFALGEALLHQKVFDGALDAFQRALSLGHPDDGIKPLMKIGECHAGLKKHAEAAEVFERAWALYPWILPAAARLMDAYYHLDQFGKALPLAQRLLDPKDPKSYGNFAALQARVGQSEEALKTLDRAKRLPAMASAEAQKWWATLASDPDFSTLKDQPAFRALFQDSQAPPAP